MYVAEIVELGEENFHDSWKDFRAAERLVEIIGEAAGNLSAELRSRLPDLPINKAKAMRNVIAHQYAHVDRHLVWETISMYVPPFVAELEAGVGRTTREHGDGSPTAPSP
jgi:uncharacterized protein with HEPN domain